MLARYVHLYAEPAVVWLGRWKQEIERGGRRPQVVSAAKTPLSRLRFEWNAQCRVRHKLAAKRQRNGRSRLDDIEQTTRLVEAITRRGVGRLCGLASSAATVLNGHPPVSATVSDADAAAISRALALARLDPKGLYIDSTSYYLGEAHFLPVVNGGDRGERVTQINDVHDHLELLYVLRGVATHRTQVGTMLRGAWLTETHALVDLVAGTDNGFQIDGAASLTKLMDETDGDEMENHLPALSASLRGHSLVKDIRRRRSKAAAHVDARLSFASVLSLLDDCDLPSVIRLADSLLQGLDAAACRHVYLGLLVIGHRRFRTKRARQRMSPRLASQLAGRADLVDSHFGVWIGSTEDGAGSAAVAGVIAGRSSNLRVAWADTADVHPRTATVLRGHIASA